MMVRGTVVWTQTWTRNIRMLRSLILSHMMLWMYFAILWISRLHLLYYSDWMFTGCDAWQLWTLPLLHNVRSHSYYHQVSFANFIAVASHFLKLNYDIFPTCLGMYVWFYCNFKWLVDNTTYWTMSAKCVHNSACYQISRLCKYLRILMYTNVYYLRLYITF